MQIETKSYRSGSYVGRPVWRGKYRIVETGKGFDVGWTLACNNSGMPIAYESKNEANAGAKVAGEDFAKGLLLEKTYRVAEMLANLTQGAAFLKANPHLGADMEAALAAIKNTTGG